MVGGCFPSLICKGLTSGRWAVFLPYSRHVSPSRHYRGLLRRNHLHAKAVRYETGNRLPRVTSAPHHLRTSAAVPHCHHLTALCPCPATVSLPHQHLFSYHITHPYPGLANDVMLMSSQKKCQNTIFLYKSAQNDHFWSFSLVHL